MKKVLILALSFVAFAFADCKVMTREQVSEISETFWELSHSSMLVQNGLDCDYGMFVNAMKPIVDIKVCVALIYKDNKQTVVVEGDSYNSKSSVYYDEYGMVIQRDEALKTKMNCVDLYKKFKKGKI
jgi:hypothetical protein